MLISYIIINQLQEIVFFYLLHHDPFALEHVWMALIPYHHAPPDPLVPSTILHCHGIVVMETTNRFYYQMNFTVAAKHLQVSSNHNSLCRIDRVSLIWAWNTFVINASFLFPSKQRKRLFRSFHLFQFVLDPYPFRCLLYGFQDHFLCNLVHQPSFNNWIHHLCRCF